MSSVIHQNTKMLEVVCESLKPLLDRFVLVGGCATALLITDEAAPEVRMTMDVDLIVDVISLVDYYSVEESLRQIGFTQGEDDDGVICRWKVGAMMVDVMPTDSKILGFSNPWYKVACREATTTLLSNNVTVKHVTAPYFIATKIEAFRGRGKGDYMMSHDLEDIVSVVDGRGELFSEILGSEDKLKQFVVAEFKKWIKDEDFLDALPGLLPPDTAGQNRLQGLEKKIASIAAIDT